MSSSAQHLLSVVRRQILTGSRPPGERISEVGLAGDFEVSRTPARTALAALEAEGLIEKRSGRGFTIRTVSTGDVENGIAVRAALEALAARTLAENGMSNAVEADLRASIQATEAFLTSDLPVSDRMEEYQDANTRFHDTIMQGCGNDLVAYTFERIAHLPLASLGALAFDDTNPRRAHMRLTVGHAQHVIIFDALNQRDAARAEAMMREHSHAALNYSALFVETPAPQQPRIRTVGKWDD